MHIARVQIEEGFLDGLDVTFVPGLNVIFGARGTGKTSLIELIRFALDVRGFNDQLAKRSLEHARAVLGSGQVTVTLAEVGGTNTIISRTSAEVRPRASSGFVSPLIFSQTEIENVGLLPASRLGLIDGFFLETKKLAAQESEVSSLIRSLTSEIANERAEIERLSIELGQLPEIDRQLTELRPQERAVSTASTEAASKATQLDNVSAEIANLSVTAVEAERFQKHLQDWHGDLSQSLPLSVDAWFSLPVKHIELQSASQVAAQRAYELQIEALKSVAIAYEKARELNQKLDSERLAADEVARVLRKEVEGIQQGAGAVARRGQQLRERRAQIISLQNLSDARRQTLAALEGKRAILLDKLDVLRETRYNNRCNAAASLNARLSPRIRVEVERAGQIEQYAASLSSLLRGTGIRYNELSGVLAQNVSPRELLEWAESENSKALSEAVGIPRDRASRTLAALRETDLGTLASLLVEDNVSFYLLDGPDYKPVGELSTGQRCTIILPIILERRDVILIVDQPEDHIDNAFIAETLVKAIVARATDGQLIVSTHNANIPVLGGAQGVTQLGSDGRRGYILVHEELEHPHAVAAITQVMEGGTEAFEKRAKFYDRHG